MAKITYEDKEQLNTNENIPAKNKCMASDLNEIKSIVNENDTNALYNTNIKNSQTNSDNDTYSCNYVNKKTDGSVLYESDGTNTNFTLNDSKENYKYIEVLYGSNGVYSSVKVDKFCASNICLIISRVGYWNESYYGIKTETSRVAISGKNVTFVKGYSNIVRADNNENVFSDTTEIKIRKVIGYK